MAWQDIMLTFTCSLIASSGFWALISTFVVKQNEKRDAQGEMLIGLGHDRIVGLGVSYLNRGWITEDEYENLYEYLYLPYKKLGGNGSAERIMDQVKKLPIRPAE